METKDLNFDIRAVSGQTGGAHVPRMQRRVAGLSRASFCRSVAPLSNKEQAKAGEKAGGITGKRAGEKALFRSVKPLNPMEIFRPKNLREKIAKKTMRLPRRKGPHPCRSNAGNSAGRESPDPKAQAIESATDFGVKKFSHVNPPSGREFFGRREAKGGAPRPPPDCSRTFSRRPFVSGKDKRWNWEARAQSPR